MPKAKGQRLKAKAKSQRPRAKGQGPKAEVPCLATVPGGSPPGKPSGPFILIYPLCPMMPGPPPFFLAPSVRPSRRKGQGNSLVSLSERGESQAYPIPSPF